MISDATAGFDLYTVEDDQLGRCLNTLFIAYTQFESAGIMEKRK